MAAQALILLGPPGAGKGTHGSAIVEQFGLVHVATGDILRAAVAAGTELGRQAKKYMDAGELVPDDVVIGIVREKLAEEEVKARGVLLDGFPRTIPQAEALGDALDELGYGEPCVLNLVVPEEELVRRLSSRRVCKQCGAIYNLNIDGLDVGDKCPKCGGEIYQRDDDKPEAIRERLRVYKEQTAPLIEYYQSRGLLREVDANGQIDEVRARVLAAARECLGGKDQ